MLCHASAIRECEHLDRGHNRNDSEDFCNSVEMCCIVFPVLSNNIFFSSLLSENAGRVKCPVDPYFIIPDRCVCVDFQTLRLQESPDAVPHGEMPRHLQLYCDRLGPRKRGFPAAALLSSDCCLRLCSSSSVRYLCDRVVPGNRVTIVGIYSIKKMAAAKAKGKEKSAGVGIRSSYLRVVGIQLDTEGAGNDEHLHHWCYGCNLSMCKENYRTQLIDFFVFQVAVLLDQCLHRKRRS